jgi:hypothetical protein
VTTNGLDSSTITIRERHGRLGLQLDSRTGLPRTLLLGHDETELAVPLALTATLLLKGQEVPGAPYGLDYLNTEQVDAFRLVEATPVYRLTGPHETYTVVTEAGEWTARWEYTFRQSHPRLELQIDLSPTRAAGKATLRDLRLDFRFSPRDLEAWRIEAPGNQLRPGVAAVALREPVTISSAGGVFGSTGLVALHRPEQGLVVVWWPFSRSEIGTIQVRSIDDGVQLTLHSGLAGRLSAGESLRYGALELDILTGGWAATRDQVPAWYTTQGLSTPHDRPEWIATASIFEVQIGYSVFWGGYQYRPYPTVRDLLADLGRIKGLGYNTLQIMPRQPYPSYNVHDYADISTSYGDEDDLRALVAACHALGMRVILDILMHGVIDREVMAQTAQRVRSGPYFARLDETTPHSFYHAARDGYHIAWSRHILDFEPHWSAGSPARHPLADQHPDWFMRDSDQNIIGIYTKAFDIANPDWQEYFAAAAEELVRRLDIDGFRFDAPTYNDLPNWSRQTERRASYSPLGCLELFASLRERLKRIKESAILYTEPSGVLFRQAMDVTYNYDEQWLINAILQPPGEQRERTAVRNGRELAAWFRDRNAVLPPGSLIAHHIDSHDTFWWPLPGRKWRREQYGVAATRALLAVFALSGGAYMTFVGGEAQIEDDVRRVHLLRATLPEIGRGAASYQAVTVDQETVYAVVRHVGHSCSVLLVNLSDQHRQATCSLDTAQLHLEDTWYEVYDAWNDRALEIGERYALQRTELHQLGLTFAAFQPRLLVIRPAAPMDAIRLQ